MLTKLESATVQRLDKTSEFCTDYTLQLYDRTYLTNSHFLIFCTIYLEKITILNKTPKVSALQIIYIPC